MTACSQSISVSSFLAGCIISSSIKDVYQNSCNIIANASSHQINAAIHYNQNEINKLLIQLLTINFIQQNEQTIQSETKNLNGNHAKQLEIYCSQKLLEISPIHGFSPKPYFLDYNISDDIRMEILTYLKPIQLFKTISRLNKQFNKNVKIMHESTNSKYNKIFETRNFTFDSFCEMEKYCNNYNRKKTGLCNGRAYVDWMCPNGYWYNGAVTNINSFDGCITVKSNVYYGEVTGKMLDYSKVAPCNMMRNRPCNVNRFKNTIIKRGYCNQACDINISKFLMEQHMTQIGDDRVEARNSWFDLKRGGWFGRCVGDVWLCGKIKFDWTLTGSFINGYDANGNLKRIIASQYDGFDDDKMVNKNLAIKSLKISQVFVDVDITKYYTKYDSMQRESFFLLQQIQQYVSLSPSRCILTVAVHGDDTSSITYFGNKSSIEDRKEMIESGFCDWSVDDAKKKFLDLIGYPNYYIVTPEGPICRLENEKEFNKWYHRWKQFGIKPALFSCEVSKQPIGNLAQKVYYNQEKDELHVKLSLKHHMLMFVDSSAPPPLKSMYVAVMGSLHRPRLVDAIITESRLIDIDNDDHDDCDANTRANSETKSMDKKVMYFERLKLWKGCIRCTFDVTDVFNEFKQRLRDEWIQHIDNKKDADGNYNNVDVDHGRYFSNFNTTCTDMPYLKYESETNRIKYDHYIGPNDYSVVKYDFQLSLFDRLGTHAKTIVFQMLRYLDGKDSRIFRRVCHEWDSILKSLFDNQWNM